MNSFIRPQCACKYTHTRASGVRQHSASAHFNSIGQTIDISESRQKNRAIITYTLSSFPTCAGQYCKRENVSGGVVSMAYSIYIFRENFDFNVCAVCLR